MLLLIRFNIYYMKLNKTYIKYQHLKNVNICRISLNDLNSLHSKGQNKQKNWYRNIGRTSFIKLQLNFASSEVK